MLVYGQQARRHANTGDCLRGNLGIPTIDECVPHRHSRAGSLGFWGICHRTGGYQAQVIPAIFAGIALAFIETHLKRIIPSYLYLVVVPFLALTSAVILAHSIIGPVGREIGSGVAFLARSAMTGDYAFIGAAIFGFLYSPLVITGVHHTTNAVDLQLMQEMGGTPIWPIVALSNMAQASAVLGIIIISKKKNEREISVPAAISAYLGVTEPAMYGINLKYRFPMLSAMIGASMSAALCGFAGVMANGIGVVDCRLFYLSKVSTGACMALQC